MKASSWRADQWVLMKHFAWVLKGADSRWLVASCTAALWHTLWSNSLTGRRLACKSRISVAVERKVPIMAVVAN